MLIWSHFLSALPVIPSQVLSQFLWYDNYIQIEDVLTYFEKFSNTIINFLSQLLENDRIILWVNLKDEYELTNDMFFQVACLFILFMFLV